MAVGIGVETFRNWLPLVDHALIADAEATDPGRRLLLLQFGQVLGAGVAAVSWGRAAARVRAAAAVGPRKSMLGERLEPLLPRLAGLQRGGAVSTEKVQIVAHAMHRLSRTGVHPDAVGTAQQLLSDYAPVLAPVELRRYARSVVNAADPGRPRTPWTTNGNKTAATWNSSNAATACGICRADSATPWVPN